MVDLFKISRQEINELSKNTIDHLLKTNKQVKITFSNIN